MPTDYSYIKPYKYKELTDICSWIAQTAIDERWLIFVKSIEEGAELKAALILILNQQLEINETLWYNKKG